MTAIRKLFVLCMLLPLVSLSQKQGNTWYFGNGAGLDFNSGSPVALNNGQTPVVGCPACHSEGTSVLSDSSGSLLMYCNGQRIWNRNHQVMLNGDSLLGHPSSTQSSIIIPMPGSDRFFYVFTTDAFAGNNLQYGFRYSVVDICLDNGLGAVVEDQKNILLLDTVAEKLTACRHANGVDYWIVTHKYFSNAFYAYQLSASGIIDTVVSAIGSVHPTATTALYGAMGQMKISPDGQKLGIVNANTNDNIAEYFDFDKNTGIVSNCVNLQWNPSMNHFYGVSFSPDNSKLYISCSLNCNGVYQFDLAAGGGHPDSVRNSRVQVASGPNFLALQLAPDGKIYVNHTPFVYNYYLDAINNPNNAGTACNYVTSAVNLNNHGSSYGLPGFVDSYDYSNTVTDCKTGLQENVYQPGIRVYPNPGNGLFSCDLDQASAIVIYNMLGEIVYRNQLAEGVQTIDISRFSDGIYFLHATAGEETAVVKLCKN